MMTYTTPDGQVLISKSSEPVVYTCATDMPDGVYESTETTFASTVVGIQQIKISRAVSNGSMTIAITESTEQELLDYIAEVTAVVAPEENV